MSSGHTVRWSDGRRLPNEEDFPSLPGSARSNVSNGHPRPGSAQPSRPASQQQQSQPRPKKKTEDFPSLGRPSSSGSNLGPAAGPAPVYRNPTGYTPAWTAAGGRGAKPKASGGTKKVAPAPILDDEDPPLPKPAAAMEPKMTRLKKQDRKELQQQQQQQREELAGNFPELAPASEAAAAEKPKEAKGKSKKKKSKGIGSLLSEISPQEPAATAAANCGVADSLAAAAALISIDDPKDKAGNTTKTDKVGEWSKVPTTKEKAKSVQPPKPAAANGDASAAIPGLAFGQSKSSSPSSSSSSRESSKPTRAAAAAPPQSKEDFPSLGPSSRPMSANFRPAAVATSAPSSTTRAVPSPKPIEGTRSSAAAVAPSSKAPPPGFGGGGGGTRAGKAPPPGFGGPTAATRGAAASSAFSYRQPGDFSRRNADLASAQSPSINHHFTTNLCRSPPSPISSAASRSSSKNSRRSRSSSVGEASAAPSTTTSASGWWEGMRSAPFSPNYSHSCPTLQSKT